VTDTTASSPTDLSALSDSGMAAHDPSTRHPADDQSPHNGKLAVVQFSVARFNDATTAHVVGDFNDWSQTDHPMHMAGDGFELTLSLPVGHRYHYRYLLDGEHWTNDAHADGYEPNNFGGDNSVLDLTDSSSDT
jgi:1,4-alpha-glucan branching enzyme